jgi:hypothetical protein
MPLIDEGEVICAVVRTREQVKPVYVSPGHKIGLEIAIRYVLTTCLGYRSHAAWRTGQREALPQLGASIFNRRVTRVTTSSALVSMGLSVVSTNPKPWRRKNRRAASTSS